MRGIVPNLGTRVGARVPNLGANEPRFGAFSGVLLSCNFLVFGDRLR